MPQRGGGRITTMRQTVETVSAKRTRKKRTQKLSLPKATASEIIKGSKVTLSEREYVLKVLEKVGFSLSTPKGESNLRTAAKGHSVSKGSRGK